MLHNHRVTFLDEAGQLQHQVFISETGKQAIEACRKEHPKAEVVGSLRLFTEDVIPTA